MRSKNTLSKNSSTHNTDSSTHNTDVDASRFPPPLPVSGTGLDPAPDPFDPASLRLTQDVVASLRVKQVFLTVPVRKPDRTWFVRTHPSPHFRLEAGVLTLKEPDESYLVIPELCSILRSETTLRPTLLVTSITRQGKLFIWPLPLPDTTGRINSWTASGLEAADAARHRWIRVQPDLQMKGYSLIVAEDDVEPEWPEMPLADILRLGFKDKLI